ncbi:MAG: N-methyl-L-tryptophan oxidase [Gordonia sp. (in: high G+C Gram-positive bacteria)]
MSGTRHADVVVLGLGIHGSAATASIARRGHRVIAIERFGSRHSRGSSHGRTRMIRRAYPGTAWTGLVGAAYRAWADLERESGTVLIRRTGGVYAHRGRPDLHGPRCVTLAGPREVAAHMSGLRIPDTHSAVYDPDAGVIEAADALTALRTTAVAHGAQLRFDERVLGWEPITDGVRVRTDRDVVYAGRLVVAAGAYAGDLLPALAPALQVWRILTLTLHPGQAVAEPPNLGAFSIDRPDGLVFGIPDAAGNGLKIGVDARQSWDPERPVAPPTDDDIADLVELAERYVPGIDATPYESAACLYTMTEDKRFTVGTLADAPQVILAAACSGHGFKFGPAIGEAVADLHEGVPRDDLDFISTRRRGL